MFRCIAIVFTFVLIAPLLLTGCASLPNGDAQLQGGINMPLCLTVCTATAAATSTHGKGAVTTSINETVSPTVQPTVKP